MRCVLASLYLTIIGSFSLSAQVDSLPLDADFVFQDGVYLTLQQLHQNQPAYEWKEVEARLAANRDRYFAQMEYIKPRGLAAIPVTDVYAFVLKGLPYIRVEDTVDNEKAATFAGLRVRGKLCYYTYERREPKTVEMAAYNPLTGKPFRKGRVKREETIVIEHVLDFATGQRVPLSREHLKALMADDPEMVRAVAELPEEGLGEKLYKCVLIYDDRNPIRLPVYPKTKNKK
ncbi:MAG TPA: hypothetical protein VJ933_00590 [Phaeodactylibacter sp.]|nr:hypothetical protein [Phaeodactylibacter sp.]